MAPNSSKDYKTGSAEKAARQLDEQRKKKKSRLDEIMSEMGHNRSGKYK